MACTIDFRFLDEGLGGQNNKRKRPTDGGDGDSVTATMDVDPSPLSKRIAVSSETDPNRPTYVAVDPPTYDGIIAGKVSGRRWKQPRLQRASATRVTRKGPSFELRNKEKEIKRAFRERMNELKEEIKKNKEEKRKIREEREKKKQENILKFGTKLQKITNPKTLQKIAKSKQKKLLKVVPEDFLAGGKKKKKGSMEV